MEGNNGSSGESNCRPPIPLSAATTTTSCRQCFSIDSVPVSCKKTLVRHQSLVKTKTLDIPVKPNLGAESHDADFVPIVRSGAWTDIGFRSSMEDVYICADNFISDYGLKNATDGPNAFYGVFDGHGGKHAADFARYHIPRFIDEDEDFPVEVERVIASAFLQTDSAFAKAYSLDAALASGTTALAALVVGRLLVVANAGDCRVVLCRRGNAIDMSNDHKPSCSKERKRIEASGGMYMMVISMDYSMWLVLWETGTLEGLKVSDSDGGPLSAEPELMTRQLTEEDEFIIIGAKTRSILLGGRLQEHNDPVMCSKDLIDEALKRKSGDNLAVIVVCFQSEPPRNLIAPRPRVHRSISADGLRELQSFLDDLAK
uniref:protein-serine/threonine phosphatase n=1 Tax=Salix viminalis TaxID=40686 RepID=A0A6N2LFA8_SALVM